MHFLLLEMKVLTVLYLDVKTVSGHNQVLEIRGKRLGSLVTYKPILARACPLLKQLGHIFGPKVHFQIIQSVSLFQLFYSFSPVS